MYWLPCCLAASKMGRKESGQTEEENPCSASLILSWSVVKGEMREGISGNQNSAGIRPVLLASMHCCQHLRALLFGLVHFPRLIYLLCSVSLYGKRLPPSRQARPCRRAHGARTLKIAWHNLARARPFPRFAHTLHSKNTQK